MADQRIPRRLNIVYGLSVMFLLVGLLFQAAAAATAVSKSGCD